MADKKTGKSRLSAVSAQKHLDAFEGKLADQSKNMPQMNPASRKIMLKAFPWISLAFAFVSLVWANDLRELISVINKVKDNFGNYEGFETYLGNTTELWVLCVGYVVIALLIGAAFFQGILRTLKKGWNFLFYAYSTAIITGLLYFLLLTEYSSSRAFMTLILGFVGLYVLFQLREHHN